jgi:hypothetical protein
VALILRPLFYSSALVKSMSAVNLEEGYQCGLK